MKWTARIFRYKGENRIAVGFELTPENILKMRNFDGAAWSASQKTWHISDSEANRKIFGLITQKVSQRHEVRSFIRWMKSKHYSENTIKTYSEALRNFLNYFGDKPAASISNDDLVGYNNDYIRKNALSTSYQNQIVNALKLYFLTVEDRKIDLEKIHRPKKEKLLPNVLSKEEVKLILTAHANIKHRTMLSLIYSCGLRRSELLNLKPADIDSLRNVIIVRQGKGRKDRLVPLSLKILEMLREYYTYFKPKVWLFEGNTIGAQYDARTLSNILKTAIAKVGITKPVSLHWLRHSYATHLLENGTDLRYIQEILGHSSSRTTEIYTHVSTQNIQMIKSPFDDL
ncbi:MAG: integrase [Flavobacterium sp.]|nr:MAG: integrase [Flavobacterium sp.]